MFFLVIKVKGNKMRKMGKKMDKEIEGIKVKC